MLDVVGFEVGENGNYDGAVGEGADESHAPHGAVLGTKYYFVARTDSALLVEEVEFGYFAGYVLVGQGGTAEVGKGGEVPVVTDCVLEI